ncbi:hypothetical protein BD413DRAFT_651214, partial [Trametes elegans]
SVFLRSIVQKVPEILWRRADARAHVQGAHFSFFAMVGVVEQYGQLRNALGSILGLFGLVRWMRDLLTGRRPIRGALRVRQRPPRAGPGPQRASAPEGEQEVARDLPPRHLRCSIRDAQAPPRAR